MINWRYSIKLHTCGSPQIWYEKTRIPPWRRNFRTICRKSSKKTHHIRKQVSREWPPTMWILALTIKKCLKKMKHCWRNLLENEWFFTHQPTANNMYYKTVKFLSLNQELEKHQWLSFLFNFNFHFSFTDYLSQWG